MKTELGDHWLRTIEPDPGETIVVRTEYEPWFVGFARWEVRELEGLPVRAGRCFMAKTLAAGRWKWVGREAKGCDFLVSTSAL